MVTNSDIVPIFPLSSALPVTGVTGAGVGEEGGVDAGDPGAAAKPPEPLPKNTCTLSKKPCWDAATPSSPDACAMEVDSCAEVSVHYDEEKCNKANKQYGKGAN